MQVTRLRSLGFVVVAALWAQPSLVAQQPIQNGQAPPDAPGPIISWVVPEPITRGTPLSSTQLNATADVAGTFAYRPATGVLLDAGDAQKLSVIFTPADLKKYAIATKTVLIDVRPIVLSVMRVAPIVPIRQANAEVIAPVAAPVAAQSIQPEPLAQPPVPLTVVVQPTTPEVVVVAAGVVDSLTPPKSAVDVSPTLATPSAAAPTIEAPKAPLVAVSEAGKPAVATDESAVTQRPTSLLSQPQEADPSTVAKDLPKRTTSIVWGNPEPIEAGTPLSARQMNATADVAGTFAYSPAVGAVLAVGEHSLTESHRVFERAHSLRGCVRWQDAAGIQPRSKSALYGWSGSMARSTRRNGRRSRRSRARPDARPRRCAIGCARPSVMPASAAA